MNDITIGSSEAKTSVSFFDRPGVQLEEIPVGPGVPFGVEQVTNSALGTGGAYGAWGHSYDNESLPGLIADLLGHTLEQSDRLNLSELGFLCRHHVPRLADEQHLALETEVGARLLSKAAQANGWDAGEVDAVLIGMTRPVSGDYIERISRAAGIRQNALKVSIHKACDGSVAGLNLALNPEIGNGNSLATRLRGKKVLVGGIEGLSRVMKTAGDLQALQLFGNGAGIIGMIPGETMTFLAGSTEEVYDEEGVLQVAMAYPHSRRRVDGQSLIEVTMAGENHIRVAGLMHEPVGDAPVVMAGPMGMVKLFVRTGVIVVRNVYAAYQRRMSEGGSRKDIAVAICHHANLKINQLKAKYLQKEGFRAPMPWLLSDFGNVSAASNMIAFMRQLSKLKRGDHVLFDGFGAGTYYDVLAVEMGGASSRKTRP